MIFDILLMAPSSADGILEAASDTMQVRDIVELSLAPAFLLVAIGGIMNVLMSRLIWIATRIERFQLRMGETCSKEEMEDLARLCARRRLAQLSVLCGTASAVSISLVILLLFISAFIPYQIGAITALAWIVSMAFLITGLVLFAREALLAATGQLRHIP